MWEHLIKTYRLQPILKEDLSNKAVNKQLEDKKAESEISFNLSEVQSNEKEKDWNVREAMSMNLDDLIKDFLKEPVSEANDKE